MLRFLKVLFFVGLVCLFVLLVIARVPAEWGAWALTRAVPQLSISGVSGTLWSGRAAGAQIIAQNNVLDLGALEWDLKIPPLLASKACVDVRSARLNGSACHGLVTGTTRVEHLTLDRIPASLFNEEVLAQLSGQATVIVQEAVVSKRGEVRELDGRIAWEGGEVNYGEGWLTLGSYLAELSENPQGGVAAVVTDTAGDFEVNLNAQYSQALGPTLDGTVKPRPGAAPMIVNALGFMGEQQDDGAVRLTWPMGS